MIGFQPVSGLHKARPVDAPTSLAPNREALPEAKKRKLEADTILGLQHAKQTIPQTRPATPTVTTPRDLMYDRLPACLRPPQGKTGRQSRPFWPQNRKTIARELETPRAKLEAYPREDTWKLGGAFVPEFATHYRLIEPSRLTEATDFFNREVLPLRMRVGFRLC
jgi:hypothetical protein